ncbi:MAG: type I restriction enzyme HsdR N-terminal domain-containing protein [Bacteroidota bacterium]
MDKKIIFDPARKKYVSYTPEEEVRQWMVDYLVNLLGYPISWVTLEKRIKYGRIYKRIDILVRERYGQPLILVECKASCYALQEAHLNQIALYNATLQAPFIMLTNGLSLFSFKLEKTKNRYIQIYNPPFFRQNI